jgi:phosphate/sulfate permease
MPYASFWERLSYSLQIWSVQSFEEFSDNDAIEKEFVDFQGNRNSEIQISKPRPESKVPGVFIVTEAYRFLMVVAALLVSLAHGSNDVANAITPLLIV